MKNLLVLGLGLFLSTSASADYIDYYDRLFKNQNLCDADFLEQVQAERAFKKMFATMKRDEELGRRSLIQVEDYVAYSSRLKNQSSGEECTIILHEDCYSAYCK